MKKFIFLAFTGAPQTQESKIMALRNGCECWNLSKLSFDDFIIEVKKRILPANDSVEKNHYKNNTSNGELFGITEKEYLESSWGLLLQYEEDCNYSNGVGESLFILNLFSPNFLHSSFHVTTLGIEKNGYKLNPLHSHSQSKSDIFNTEKFANFYDHMSILSGYGEWSYYRSEKWESEDWRIFGASLLYLSLEKYEFAKNTLTWPKEAVDMSTILETLFTTDNAEVVYKMKKRIAIILSEKFPEIEPDITKLYNERSEFVHGVYFQKLQKESKKSETSLPLPKFEFLYKQKEYIRFILVAYLILKKCIAKKDPRFSEFKTVLDILEHSIIDISTRSLVREEIKPIFDMMPLLK